MAFMINICSVLRLILAFFIPPAAVLWAIGCRMHFWINVILTLLGIVPGIAHAIYILCCYENQEYNMDTNEQDNPVIVVRSGSPPSDIEDPDAPPRYFRAGK